MHTTFVGVPDLLACDWFNPEGSKANTTRKGYKPVPLNAVVVKKWDNKMPPLEKQVVFVTNIQNRSWLKTPDIRAPGIFFGNTVSRLILISEFPGDLQIC